MDETYALGLTTKQTKHISNSVFEMERLRFVENRVQVDTGHLAKYNSLKPNSARY